MAVDGQYRALVRAGLLAAALALAAGPVAACRLALVLAIDVSSSVDAAEDALQRQGLARALLAPPVVAAFLASPDPVALYAFEWSGREVQVDLTPGWMMIDSAPALEAAAGAIAASRRSRDNLPTALGRALGHAADALRDGPDCAARTIDVAGDGPSNDGFGPQMAYAAFPFDGVTVNALVVTAAGDDGLELLSWFREEVLHGPGAFLIATEGFDDYQRAMEAKLIRELALPALSLGLPHPLPSSAVSPPAPPPA